MSLVRFGTEGSHVYVYYDIADSWRCCGCALDRDFWFTDWKLGLEHLRKHVDAGHCVPAYVIRYAEEEAAR